MLAQFILLFTPILKLFPLNLNFIVYNVDNFIIFFLIIFSEVNQIENNPSNNMAAASKELEPTDSSTSSNSTAEDGIFSIVYATLKKVAVVGAIYFIGYMDWSVAWLITPVIFSVIRDQWKKAAKAKRNIAIACAMASEKDVILAKITDLPSWVNPS